MPHFFTNTCCNPNVKISITPFLLEGKILENQQFLRPNNDWTNFPQMITIITYHGFQTHNTRKQLVCPIAKTVFSTIRQLFTSDKIAEEEYSLLYLPSESCH